MKINKAQLKQIIKEELHKLKEGGYAGHLKGAKGPSGRGSRKFNLYEIDDIIDEMFGGRADSYLAEQLQAWWEGLQDDPAFMEIGKDPNDKFSGRRG